MNELYNNPKDYFMVTQHVSGVDKDFQTKLAEQENQISK